MLVNLMESFYSDRKPLNTLVTENLKRSLNDSACQLSLARLQALSDFAAYLADIESEEATQELLAIPGLLERVQQNRMTPKSQYVSWRDVRSDL